MNNPYIEKYRRESIILYPNNNVLNDTFLPKDLNNLRSHLSRIQGSPGKNGTYYDPRSADSYPGAKVKERGFVPCKLSWLNEQLQALNEEFKKYVQERLNLGDRKPEEWPERLKVKRLEIEAKIQVAREEIQKLQELIQKLEEKQPRRESLLKHPKDWGTGRLRDGILVSIGPWDVGPDEEGLLRIATPDSPYFHMPIWQFKSQIVRAMGMEYSHRVRQEQQASMNEGRPRRNVKYPEPPNYVNGNIEYPASYAPSTIKKIKQETE